jgi:hypothetical protein
MIWEAIAGGVKGLGDTILGFVREFHMDPAQAAELEQKVRQAQLDFERHIMDLEIQDRDSARKREMTVKDATPRILAYGITSGFFGVLFYILNFDIPNESENVVYVMLGSLGTAWTGIMAYYFGSSAGSAAKHNLLDKLTSGGKG